MVQLGQAKPRLICSLIHKLAARGEALLSIVYATDAKIEPGVKVVGVFPDNPDDPIVYPVAATVSAKPGTTQYLAFLRSAEAKSIFEGYGFSVHRRQDQ